MFGSGLFGKSLLGSCLEGELGQEDVNEDAEDAYEEFIVFSLLFCGFTSTLMLSHLTWILGDGSQRLSMSDSIFEISHFLCAWVELGELICGLAPTTGLS